MFKENVEKILKEKSIKINDLIKELNISKDEYQSIMTSNEVDEYTLNKFVIALGCTKEELVGKTETINEAVVDNRPVLGTCQECGKQIRDPNDFFKHTHYQRGNSSTVILCKKCDAARLSENSKEVNGTRIKAYIFGALFVAVFMAFGIFMSINNDDWRWLGINAVISLMGFSLIVCSILDNNFIGDMFGDMCEFGFITTPTFFFELDIDGIIKFLIIKGICLVLSMILVVLLFIFAFFLCGAISVFVLPYALIYSYKYE